MASSAPVSGQPAHAFAQVYLLRAFILFSVLMADALVMGIRGFAPLVGLAGLFFLPLARPARADWPGLAILLLLIAWASVGVIWSPAENLHVAFSAKTFTRLTILHLALQLVLCGSFVTAMRRLEPDAAGRILAMLGFALLAALAILTEEGLSHAALYQAIQSAIHKPVRPDIAVRALAQGGHVTAALVWPLGVAFHHSRRPVLALVVAAFVPLSMVLLRGVSPTLALALSLPVFLLVRRFGRPVVLGLLVLTVAYVMLTPLVMLTADHLNAYARFKDHLPPSWAERLRIWSFVVEQFTHHPLRGAGLDASRTFPGIVPLHPHNAPLQVWFELGLPGALLAAAFWGWLWWRIGRRSDERLFAAVASATATAYLAVSAVGFGVWQEWWICVGALAMAACLALGRALKAPAPAGSPAPRS